MSKTIEKIIFRDYGGEHKNVELDRISESFNLIVKDERFGRKDLLGEIARHLDMNLCTISRSTENEEIRSETFDSVIEFKPGGDSHNKVLIHIKNDRTIKKSGFYAYPKDSFAINLVDRAIDQFFMRDQEISKRSKCINPKFTLHFDTVFNEFVIRDDEMGQFLLTDLGNGMSSLFSIIADIAIKIAIANTDLGEEALELTSGIVLIDDLELFLDPKQQSEIIEDLMRTFPNVQFFATTNSPIVIQSLNKGKLIKVTKNNIEYVATDAFRCQSVEDILEDVFDLPMPSRSKRYQRMIKASEEFYALLEKKEDATEAKAMLDKLSVAFGDNPAYYGYLEYRAKVKKSE